MAGMVSALVLAMSAVGNISSGFLLRAGVPIWANIAAAFAGFAVSGFVVYAGTPSPAAIVVAAALALGLGGLALAPSTRRRRRPRQAHRQCRPQLGWCSRRAI
jgi:hypothetical protein